MTLNAMEFVETLNAQLEPGQKKIMLSPDQAKVVETDSVPTLVVAGAGSGKTEVMSLRALYLMYRDGLEPDSILGLTFTRKATANFTERILRQLDLMRKAGLLGEADTIGSEPTVATYNSFAKNLVSEYGLQIGVSPSVIQLSEARAWQVVERLLQEYTGPLPQGAKASTMRDAILSLSQSLTEHQVVPARAAQDFERVAAAIKSAGPGTGATGRQRTALPASAKSFVTRMEDKALLMPLVQRYWDYKREHDLIDFTDQLALARQIIDANPTIGAELRDQYRAVLLDEFQDTSVGQLQLFSSLFRDTAATAVGDPNQAIYGWRGASAASLSMFLPYFDTQGRGGVLELRDAWRNWPAILEAANVVSSADKVETQAREEAFAHMDLASQIEMQSLRANPKHPGRGVVKYMFPSTRDEEFELVARLIKRWQENVPAGQKQPSIAILSRKRKFFAPLYAQLQKLGVNARIVGVGGLLTEPAVTDIVAVMRSLAVPDNGAAVMRLVANLDLSSADIKILWDWAREQGKQRISDAGDPETIVSDVDRAKVNTDKPEAGADLRVEFLLDAVLTPPTVGWKKRGRQGFSPEAYSRVSLLARRLDLVREHMDAGVTTLISKVVKIFDLDLDIASDPFDNQGEVAIDAFIDFAANYEAETPYASVKNFLEWIDTTLETEERLEAPVSEPDEGVVLLLTIHQAKGLEWDKVVVVGLTESDFPGVVDARNAALKQTVDLNGPLPAIQPSSGWTSELGEIPYSLRLDSTHEGRVILPTLPEMTGLDVVGVEETFDEYRLQLSLHELAEARRLAYVAWTRASDELVLSGSWYAGQTQLVPSRYLMQMVQGKSEASEPLAIPVTVEDLVAEAGEEIPQPVVLKLEDATKPEECLTDQAVFPAMPSKSRQLITGAAQAVNRAMEMYYQESDENTDFDALIDDLLKTVESGAGGNNGEIATLVHSVRDAITRQNSPRTPAPVIEIDRLNATQAFGLLDDPYRYAMQVRRPIPHEPSKAAQIGTAFHNWAEQWLAKAGQLDDALEPATNKPLTDIDSVADSGDSGDMQSLTGAEKKLFEQLTKRAREVVGNNPEGVHAVEADFAYTKSGVTIRGRYDVVLNRDGKWVVLDWKTGAPPKLGAKNPYLRQYATQLEIYRRALAKQKGVDQSQIDAVLVFLGGPDTQPSERILRLEDLEKLLGDYNFEQQWDQLVNSFSPHPHDSK
ncbi:MAG: ATP-dependent DNA helicase [Actinomyces sp.]|uniref:ATP-dependent DNA helicase n=1 Tax=uncultured Actinomyces sp. TaxID=249061 RepID=UPI00280621F4|nr:ATP-dependent DNA helicase [uncultured Actinomyces sp.]MDU4831647.1 ATP-dependent DNA helicase [Actinomyces sp.]